MSSQATEEDISLIKKLFVETAIRGSHATGISYIHDGKIITIKLPIPAEEFVESFDFSKIMQKGSISMIGHIRYSTSDVRYNQPFHGDWYAIAHNGVLSQEDKSEWPYETETANDSEMVLKCLEDKKHPLNEFPDGSMAVTVLQKDGTVSGFRNGERPLWFKFDGTKMVFTSTKDIAERSGIKNSEMVGLNQEISYDGELDLAREYQTNKKDLQIAV